MSVGQNIKKGTRVLGVDRRRLAASLKKRYDAGESIRSLATSTGRSYGFIHRLLTESGVSLRRRSRTAEVQQIADTRQVEIPVQIYLADALPGPAVEQALLEVLLTSGVEDIRETPVVISSWYRSLTGLLKRAADSEVAAEARRAVELQVLARSSRSAPSCWSRPRGRSSSGNSLPAR
jgi:Helix-turn-helix domain